MSISSATLLPQHKASIRIENVVASSSVNQKIDLRHVAGSFEDVEYHPDAFPGLVFRMKVPKTAILIFSTGKMVCTGTKSSSEAVQAVKIAVNMLRKGGINIRNEPITVVQNVVASVSLGGKVDLEEAARQLPKAMYEPEQFPGLIHRMADPKTVILIFASGKLVCTGAKTEEDVLKAVTKLHVSLEQKGLMTYP